MVKQIGTFLLLLIFLNIPDVLAQGIENMFVIRTLETVTSESITMTDSILAELVSDFSTKNGIYFKKGTIVELLPKEVKKRGFAGRGGYIEIRNGIVKDGNGKEYMVLLRQKVQGDDRDWVIACMGVFTCTIILIPLDFIGFVKGKSACIEAGTTIECQLDTSL